MWDSFSVDPPVLSVKQTERGVRLTLFVRVRELNCIYANVTGNTKHKIYRFQLILEGGIGLNTVSLNIFNEYLQTLTKISYQALEVFQC